MKKHGKHSGLKIKTKKIKKNNEKGRVNNENDYK